MPRDPVDPAIKNTVILHYSPAMECACCAMDEWGYLNLVPLRPDQDGNQIFSPQDAPTPDRKWQMVFDQEFPTGYGIYCSNCVISHPLGLCPRQSVSPPSEPI